ncbi:MAG: methyltransferase domain-containing protein [Spirochaetes bacterium]|jgi:SAM-dependent methyltransferase|nr:methyltransferase domain-containing protein [Spirochaetota bacterium]
MASDTAAYYDANTKRFLTFGLGSASGSIHRAVWAPGIHSRLEAMHYVDSLILDELGSLAPPPAHESIDMHDAATVRSAADPLCIDLGCGVGGTIAYLEQHVAGRYQGITNSHVQRGIAGEQARRRGSGAVFTVDDHGDPDLYQSRLPRDGVDIVYMIESFVHASDPETVLRGVAHVLRPGGRLVICDDMLACPEAADSPTVEAFARGWHAHNLLTVDRLTAIAASIGLARVENRDLTPHVELRRPRDRIIRLIAPLIPLLKLRTPFWDNMYGGDALQRALLGGLLQYRYVVFEA